MIVIYSPFEEARVAQRSGVVNCRGSIQVLYIPKRLKGVTMAQQLNDGDSFPEYVVKTVDGKTLKIPQDLAGEYAVLLFYRGGW